MGQQLPKLSSWIEKAQAIEDKLEEISHQIDIYRAQIFDLAEIPHLRDLGSPSFSSDFLLVDNAFSYMKNSYHSQQFLKEIDPSIKQIQQAILVQKQIVLSTSKKYDSLARKFRQLQASDITIQNFMEHIEWKRNVLLDYFNVESRSQETGLQYNLNEILSQPVIQDNDDEDDASSIGSCPRPKVFVKQTSIEV